MSTTREHRRNLALGGLVALVPTSFALVKGAQVLGIPGLPRVLTMASGLLVVVVGLTLVLLTLKSSGSKLEKAFLLLAGGSPAAMLICAILHNLVYALCQVWFGADFWPRHGTDEPFFLILAVIVCPILFVVGSIGSLVLWFRNRPLKTS
ncbi:MAG: hypothetical protein JSS02_32995 [Planctomycetes bacterium]|nr:hypothetical protein [Planctomycetota bacterium]